MPQQTIGGAGRILAKHMNPLFPASNASSSGRRTARRRRIAASLLVGWFAFWLNGSVLACCPCLTQDMVSAGQAIATNGPTAGSNLSNQSDPLRSTCAELAAPMRAAASVAPGPTDRSDSSGAEFTVPLHPFFVPSLLSTATPRFDSTRPPHVPLYLRTARLLT